jgi:hypothetical protein
MLEESEEGRALRGRAFDVESMTPTSGPKRSWQFSNTGEEMLDGFADSVAPDGTLHTRRFGGNNEKFQLAH